MQKNNDSIHIIADDREHRSEVIMPLMDIGNVEVCIRRLFMGDYQINSRLIDERKALKDFGVIKRKARLETEDQHE